MKKFLINCSFAYYKSGYKVIMPNYALIISYTEDSTEDMEDLIIEELKKLNFDLPKKSFKDHYEISFTAQQIT